MTGFFEIFNPGNRHWREQRDFDKVAVVPTRKGGKGPLQIDLDGGTVVVPGSEGRGLFRETAGPDTPASEASAPTSAAAQLGGGTVSGPVVNVEGTLRRAKEQKAEQARLEDKRKAEEAAQGSRKKSARKARPASDRTTGRGSTTAAAKKSASPTARRNRGER